MVLIVALETVFNLRVLDNFYNVRTISANSGLYRKSIYRNYIFKFDNITIYWDIEAIWLFYIIIKSFIL